MRIIFSLFIILATLCISPSVFARSGGHAFGGGLIISSPPQDNLDSVVDSVNASQSVAVGKFGGAYEFFGHYSYRFSGSMFALQFRPSYFTQSTDGNGREISLTGFSFYPILRLYPLENNFIKFFLQAGLGYGQLNGEMSDGGGKIEFSGGSFGALGGLGAEFCFTKNHCMVVEGNLRYNPIVRNVVDSKTGSPDFDLSQDGKGQELEFANGDLQTTLSGIQGAISYTFSF